MEGAKSRHDEACVDLDARSASEGQCLVKFPILREVNENGKEGSRRYSSRIVVADIGDIF